MEMKVVSTMKGDYISTRMSRFCANCEMMHVHLAVKDVQFGLWMLSNEDTWRLRTPVSTALALMMRTTRVAKAMRVVEAGRAAGGGHAWMAWTG